MAQQRNRAGSGEPIVSGMCSLCRYPASVGPGTDHPTYNGDRILVSKFAYEMGDPARWDVVVFKYPEGAEINYIKRLVGLPNEKVRIWHGDIYVTPDGEPERITRRPPYKLRAMAQIVYDNNYVSDELTQAGWPLRWQDLSGMEKPAWQSTDGGRSFSVAPAAGETQWLRYRHFVPSVEEWQAIARGRLPQGFQPRPLLITDFVAYNTGVERGHPPDQPRFLGMHWVGDLMLELDLESTDGKGSAEIDLVKAGRHFRCAINVETGEAQLSIDGQTEFRPTAQTSIQGAGSYHVTFSNIDHELLLLVDGSPVEFDAPTDYPPFADDVPRSTADDPLDLAPAGVGSKGAGLSVSDLRLWRDVYYIAASHDRNRGMLPTDYTGPRRDILSMNYGQLLTLWSSPQQWGTPGDSIFDQRQEAEFPLAADQFFMLGDNSPMSQDARLWDSQQFVERELLIGKALLIFWPHSFDRIPGTRIPFPFFPNFARMGLIR